VRWRIPDHPGKRKEDTTILLKMTQQALRAADTINQRQEKHDGGMREGGETSTDAKTEESNWRRKGQGDRSRSHAKTLS